MRGANRGENWSDLRINDIIVAQSRATRGTARDIEVHGWEREIMGRALEVEGRMVTGEMAFMAARLFALESRWQINRVSERLDAAEQTIREMRELVTEHEAEIGSLNTQVSSLENRLRHRGRRVVIQHRDSSGGSTQPPTSSGTSSYGSRPLEGFVGTGSEEDPMTFVSVDRCHSGIFFAFFRHFSTLFIRIFLDFPTCFMPIPLYFSRILWPFILFNSCNLNLSF